jgi:hypothetical protein
VHLAHTELQLDSILATAGWQPTICWPAAGHQLVSSRKRDNSWGKAAQQLDNILTITGQQLGISWSAAKSGTTVGETLRNSWTIS